jgi:hypothetical protein
MYRFAAADPLTKRAGRRERLAAVRSPDERRALATAFFFPRDAFLRGRAAAVAPRITIC